MRVNVGAAPGLIYDFSGFPEELYAIEYRAPGSPEVAGAVVDLLEGAGIDVAREATRGWDHGLWVPMRLLFPDAAVPDRPGLAPRAANARVGLEGRGCAVALA